MNCISENIIDYIPQRHPFVMVDTILECNDEGATTSFEVKSGNIFYNYDCLEEVALVENIAQTAAARVGYICAQENKPVPIGFIGAVQNLDISRSVRENEVLKTTITIKNQIFNATIIQGEIKVEEEIIATCEMKIFIQ